MKVSVSFLKCKSTKEETLELLDNTSCNYIHVDLTDGVFAGEKNYDISSTLSLLSCVKKPLDIHLMVAHPDQEIESFAILNPRFLTVHVELQNVKFYIDKIKGLGIPCGLAINPDTSIEALKPYLKDIDLVLVMSVHPGYGGQQFMKETEHKLKELYELRNHGEKYFAISVDGGINEETISFVKDYADIVVSGSFICCSDDFEEKIKKLSK